MLKFGSKKFFFEKIAILWVYKAPRGDRVVELEAQWGHQPSIPEVANKNLSIYSGQMIVHWTPLQVLE